MRTTLHYGGSVITVAAVKVVVSGSAGFIGTHLVDALIERGYRVTGIDRQARAAFPGYEHRSFDLAYDPARTGIAALMSDADLVFHLAARPGVRGSTPMIEGMRKRDNVLATRNLLDAMPLSATLVATSSSSVYGGSVGGTPSREDQPLRPRGGYARSKMAMEALCEARRVAGGVTAVVRPFTVAGEGQRADMAFSLWLDALRAGEPIRVFGSETRSRDITDVRDVVEGLIRAGERRVDGAVNLGTGRGHRLIDMAITLLEVSGLEGDIVGRPAVADEADETLADTARCRRLLGFVPQTDLHALLARQIDAALPRAALAVR